MKFYTIILIIFLSNLLVSQDKMNSVILKFENDSISFNQYSSFAKIYCFDVFDKSDNLQDEYFKLYNKKYPFPRIIREDAIKNNLSKFISIDIVKQKCSCSKFFDNDKLLKEKFILLIKDKKSYNDEEYVSEYYDDFLRNYYIKVSSD